MVAIEQLDQNVLRELSQQTDQLGVVSTYVNADRGHDPNLQAAAIDLQNRFRELQRRVSEDVDSDDRRHLAGALERLWPQVESRPDRIGSRPHHLRRAGR